MSRLLILTLLALQLAICLSSPLKEIDQEEERHHHHRRHRSSHHDTQMKSHHDREASIEDDRLPRAERVEEEKADDDETDDEMQEAAPRRHHKDNGNEFWYDKVRRAPEAMPVRQKADVNKKSIVDRVSAEREYKIQDENEEDEEDEAMPDIEAVKEAKSIVDDHVESSRRKEDERTRRMLLLELEREAGLRADRTRLDEDKRRRLLEQLMPRDSKVLRDLALGSGLEALRAAKEDKKSSLDELMKKAKDNDKSKEEKKEPASPAAKKDKLPMALGQSKVGVRPRLIKPKDSGCHDIASEETCKAFKPVCPMFPTRAYIFCRKTCEKCTKDKPKGMELQAKIPAIGGHIRLVQCAPRTSVMMAACAAPQNKSKSGEKPADKIEIVPDREYGLQIHDYASIEKEGAVCKDVGPEYNPFNVLRGGPMSTMKKLGNLGNIKFCSAKDAKSKFPSDWPKEAEEKLKCKEGQMAAYGVFNHLDLHDMFSIPAFKPIVIHEKRDNTDLNAMLKNVPDDKTGLLGRGLACGVLECGNEEMKKKLEKEGWSVDKIKKTKQEVAKGQEASKEEGEEKEGDGEKKSPLQLIKEKIMKLGADKSSSEESKKSGESTENKMGKAGSQESTKAPAVTKMDE